MAFATLGVTTRCRHASTCNQVEHMSHGKNMHRLSRIGIGEKHVKRGLRGLTTSAVSPGRFIDGFPLMSILRVVCVLVTQICDRSEARRHGK